MRVLTGAIPSGGEKPSAFQMVPDEETVQGRAGRVGVGGGVGVEKD